MPEASIVAQGSAAEGLRGPHADQQFGAFRGAADPWTSTCGFPVWALAQLRHAVSLAAGTPPGTGVATHLYRSWFTYPLPGADSSDRTRYGLPIAGVCRDAHAGSTRRRCADGIEMVDRHDIVGADGWWRTWGTAWTPPMRRAGIDRVLITPGPQRLAAVVRIVTTALLDSPQPWSLACATSPRRLRRCAAVVLDLHWPQLSAELLTALAPHLRPESPPLCLPLAPGVAVAGHPGSTSTFGELRCRLVAAALRRVPDGADPLPEIAALFRAHGIDPATPYRQRALPGA